MRRILNPEVLTDHGNIPGRKHMLDILEAGLQASDPYYNTLKAMHLDGDTLIVGASEFIPEGDPYGSVEVIDLKTINRIFVFGAGKGSQRVARAIEDVLGSHITDGHIIDKHGGERILNRIGVTFGAHPVPDEGCINGCRKIMQMTRDLKADDLVFTVVSNGVSSLLTLPVPGISLEDVRQITYLMQIELGVPTGDLNPVRNHLDQLKGGRLSRYIQPAQAIHFIAWGPYTYQHLTREQVWLHTLPEGSTFADAIHSLKKWNAWYRIPDAVKKHLEQADPLYETVKVDEFAKMRTRIFGLMPDHLGALPAAGKKAASLGYQPHVLYNSVDMKAEARQVAMVVSSIARNIEKTGQPFQPPSALIGRTEMIVTVGKEKGMGGRNQEYALEAARHIKGSTRIIMGSVDTDGTDGPGKQFTDTFDEVPVLNGAIVDGTTILRAQEIGIDIHEALRCHNTSPVLYKLGDGVIATQNISMNDLSVTLISDA